MPPAGVSLRKKLKVSVSVPNTKPGISSHLGFKFSLLMCLYFSQGLPFGFLSQALPAMLRSYGVDLDKIGLVSLVALPWAFKFLWAPYVDHYGWARLGRRKSWIVPLQLGFFLCLFGMALLNPDSLTGSGFYVLLVILFLSNLIAATQDIATDGLAVESIPPKDRGLANGIQVGGYRVGMLFGGGVVLILLERLGWFSAFSVMALLILLVSVPVWLFKEPKSTQTLEHDSPANVLKLFRAFIVQPGMWGWVLVIVFFKIGDSFGSAMGKPLLIDLGLTLEQVGWISGGGGMASGISGALLGGWLVPRLGRVRALLGFGVLQACSLLGYWWLAVSTLQIDAVWLVIVLEHFIGGMSTAALFTLMMDACRHPLAGTDYTIQASIQVMVAGFMHSVSGFSAKWFGYEIHFLLAFALGMIALLPIALWLRNVPDIQKQAWHAT